MGKVHVGGIAVLPPPSGIFAYSKEFAPGDIYEQIWSVPLTGGTPVQVTTGTTDGDIDTDPVASPDGSQIVFLRTTGFGNFTLWIVDADGSGDTEIDPSACDGPMWFPSGNKILYREGNSISEILPDGTGHTVLITKTDAFGPCISPDGTMIAFVVNTPSSNDVLWVMDADGSNSAAIDTLTTSGRGGLGVCWTNDSSLIVYETGGASGQAYKIAPDGTGKTDITSGNIGPAFTKWSMAPDDSVVFTPNTQAGSPWALTQIPLSGAGESAVSPSLGVRASVGQGQAAVWGGRVYTVRSSDGCLVSILPDGSDLRVEDTPGGTETIKITGNGTEN